MKKSIYCFKILFLMILFIQVSYGQKKSPSYFFTVSMERPNTHYYHVELQCDGIKGDNIEFKMPIWTPGYYLAMDYAKYVINFNAKDESGNILPVERSSRNGWKIKNGKLSSFKIGYDVFAYNHSVADSYLDDFQGFISPTGVFIYPAGGIKNQVKVHIVPFKNWTKITTGLDNIANEPNTFYASDFDVLYDSPILIGNQEVISFNVNGIPHELAGSSLGKYDKDEVISFLTKIVLTATDMMGEIPYTHYAFIVIGPGGGGLEHLNSMAITLSPNNLSGPALKTTLPFMCHEYFHNFNVKRIRPINLGPFDYDNESFTNMLWVSEGFTVYYEGMVLLRAGLMTRQEFFDLISACVNRYESVPGHLFESATESSFNTWLEFFNRNPNSSNTTISYYDKGAALGLLLDCKIRFETKNNKSLDDVMRTLYEKFYKEKKRGFTDKEFQNVCEETAGCSLQEIFDYASTVEKVDYNKYLSLAGLQIDSELQETKGAYLGASVQDQQGSVIVSSIDFNSPAYNSDLSIQDEIIALDNNRITARNFNEIINQHKPGDKIKLTFSHRGKINNLEIILDKNLKATYKITPVEKLTPLQETILKGFSQN